jgi:hypothetical protein
MLNTYSDNKDVFRDVFLADHRTLATRYDVLLTSVVVEFASNIMG